MNILLSCVLFGNFLSKGLSRAVDDALEGSETLPTTREQKSYPEPNSGYQVIRFANEACQVGQGKEGTCYTPQECKERGGMMTGPCADGYGVCCVTTLNCGGHSMENCTYFDSHGPVEEGVCTASICPCMENICQLRLDFENFDITGPSTASSSASGGAKITKSGAVTANVDGTGTPATLASRCLVDTFHVTGASGSDGPPTICGTNTNEHMYIDVKGHSCNDLTFVFGSPCPKVTSRTFSIKVTQYSCHHPNLAPQGCTQYFFGSNTGVVRSYNFDHGKGRHLANQDQHICFRRERNQCRICFVPSIGSGDFDISGSTAAAAISGMPCGSYSQQMSNFDHVQIPGAVSAKNGMPQNSKFCGRAFQTTVCTGRTPFALNFRSDAFEFAAVSNSESSAADRGFEVAFFMDAENCAGKH